MRNIYVTMWVVILLSCLNTRVVSQNIDLFSVAPLNVKAGDSVTMEWNVTCDCEVFIYPIGDVELSGMKNIAIANTTIFTMVYSDDLHYESDSVEVNVLGNKGTIDSVPDLIKYQLPIQVQITNYNFAGVISELFSILQDTLDFSVEKFIEREGKCYFQTNLSEKDYLTSESDKKKFKIEKRRISYYVIMEKKSDTSPQYLITIKSYIEYKKYIYDYKVENNEKLYNSQNTKLKNLIKFYLNEHQD